MNDERVEKLCVKLGIEPQSGCDGKFPGNHGVCDQYDRGHCITEHKECHHWLAQGVYPEDSALTAAIKRALVEKGVRYGSGYAPVATNPDAPHFANIPQKDIYLRAATEDKAMFEAACKMCGI